MYTRITSQILFACVLFSMFLFVLHEAVAVTVVNTVNVQSSTGGQHGVSGVDGVDGGDGQDGADGMGNGTDGKSSVYVRSVINGVVVEEYDSTSASAQNEIPGAYSAAAGVAGVEPPDDEYYARIQELLAIVRLMLQAYVSE